MQAIFSIEMLDVDCSSGWVIEAISRKHQIKTRPFLFRIHIVSKPAMLDSGKCGPVSIFD